MHEARERKKRQERVLVTTLTKKSAELLSEFFVEHNMPSRYMHSNVDTLERTVIIQDFREGVFDVLVGINLLREGLDLPECSLVAIFDADKAGYLRSKTSLIQTIGRAARHVNGMCILYTDKPHLENQPVPLQEAVTEIEERRALQMRYNTRHNIIPTSITKPVYRNLHNPEKDPQYALQKMSFPELVSHIKNLEKSIEDAVEATDYATAHELQKNLKRAQKLLLKH